MFWFDGCYSRTEFWLALLAIWILHLIALIIVVWIFKDQGSSLEFHPSGGIKSLPEPNPAVYGMIVLIMILYVWAIFCTIIKRFHDRGKSGVWSLMTLVPYIGVIWVIIECGFFEGVHPEDKYSSPPLLS